MLTVALTGNLASGKSAVAEIWRAAGVPVISADDLSRESVRPGSEGLDEVRRSFGDEMVLADGTLDRERLRDVVFRDPSARRRLEALLHPRIAQLREEWIEARRREGHPLVVSEIPLLFEAGLQEGADLIVVVHAPEAERARRLVEDRGLDPEEARRMMAAQGDPARKLEGADHVLENDGTPGELMERALALLAELRETAGVAASGERAGLPRGRDA